MERHEKEEIIDAINNSHQIAFQAFNTLFDNTVKGFSEQLGQFEERNAEHHNQIMLRQDITNGRVNSLEKETVIFRWCSRNPKLAVVVFVLLFTGAITLGVVLGIDNLIGIMP